MKKINKNGRMGGVILVVVIMLVITALVFYLVNFYNENRKNIYDENSKNISGLDSEEPNLNESISSSDINGSSAGSISSGVGSSGSGSGGGSGGSSSGSNDAGSVTRSLTRSIGSNNYTSGKAINVQLNLIFSSADCAPVIKEYVPAGWLVSNISGTGDGIFDQADNSINWAPIYGPSTNPVCGGQSSYMFSYIATPNSSQTGIKTFGGILSIDGKDYSIGGESTIAS
jgi:hypothetical protein